MTWRWKARPPEVLTLVAGNTETFMLEIEGPGAAPSVVWDDSRIGEGLLAVDPQDSRRVQISMPVNQHGLYRISYRIKGEPMQVGLLTLQVQAVSSEYPTSPAPQQDVETDVGLMSSTHSIPENEDHTHFAMISEHREEPNSELGMRGRSRASRSPEGVEAGADTTRNSELVYVVEVLRGGLCIPGLSAQIVPHRVVTVGRYSRSHGHLPDIDLVGQFGEGGNESLCARRQAEIFWHVGRLQIRNLGTNPLQLREPDGSWCDLHGVHDWLPGQPILLPGGLELQLTRRTSA